MIGIPEEVGALLPRRVVLEVVVIVIFLVFYNLGRVNVVAYPRILHEDVLDPPHFDSPVFSLAQEEGASVRKRLQQLQKVLLLDTVAIRIGGVAGRVALTGQQIHQDLVVTKDRRSLKLEILVVVLHL